MNRVDGFVVVGPAGIFPGSFTTSREKAFQMAEATVIVNRGYRATDVRVSAAAIVRARGAKTWPLAKDRVAALDARIWGRRNKRGRVASQSSQKSRHATARTTAARR